MHAYNCHQQDKDSVVTIEEDSKENRRKSYRDVH